MQWLKKLDRIATQPLCEAAVCINDGSQLFSSKLRQESGADIPVSLKRFYKSTLNDCDFIKQNELKMEAFIDAFYAISQGGSGKLQLSFFKFSFFEILSIQSTFCCYICQSYKVGQISSTFRSFWYRGTMPEHTFYVFSNQILKKRPNLKDKC